MTMGSLHIAPMSPAVVPPNPQLAADLLQTAWDPCSSMGALRRCDSYEQIGAPFLTAHTARLLEVRGLRDRLYGLAPTDFYRNGNEIASSVRKLTQLAYFVLDLYSERGLLPAFAIERLVNEAYKGKDAVAMQIDFDVWMHNRADKSGSLVDELIPALSDWFLTHIKNSKKAFEAFGAPPTVVRTAQRTSFVVIGPNAEQGDEFIKFVMEELRHLEPDIKKSLCLAQTEGRVSAKVGFDDFKLTAAAHHSKMRLKGLGRVSREDRLKEVSNELARLSAEVKFLKDNPPVDRGTLIGGVYVYDDPALPIEIDPLYASLRYYVDKKAGFIFPGQFGYGHILDPEARARHEYPEYNDDIGLVSRPLHKNGGGAVERLLMMTDTFLAAPNRISAEKLRRFKQAVDDLALRILNLGETARRFSRYPMLMKAKRYWEGEKQKERADFFVEEISRYENIFGVEYDKLVAIEVDDGRAFGENYPSPDLVDGHFQMIKKILFDMAKEYNLYPPVMAAEGDQIRVAFSTTTADGGKIDAEEFLREYQRRVREHFAPMQFQALAKVETRDGPRKLPVWVNDDGKFLVQSVMPAGFKPFKKGLTVTLSYADKASLSSEGSSAVVNWLIRQMFDYIDTLKSQRGIFVKEGFGKFENRSGEGI